MSTEPSLMERLKQKHAEIALFLRRTGHEVGQYQYHLDPNSLENIYWNHGYMEALADMMRLVIYEQALAARAKRPAGPWVPPAASSARGEAGGTPKPGVPTPTAHQAPAKPKAKKAARKPAPKGGKPAPAAPPAQVMHTNPGPNAVTVTTGKK